MAITLASKRYTLLAYAGTLDSRYPLGDGAFATDRYSPTKFVTTTASGAGDGSIGSPWTMTQALANAAAGDIVRVAPGVYSGSSTANRFTPTFNAANSGTALSPIVFFAQYPAVHNESGAYSELRNGVVWPDAGGCPTLGVYNKDYVVWDGFYVNEIVSSGTADTGPAVLWGTTGSKILRSLIQGAGVSWWADNHMGVRIESCNAAQVADCVVRDFETGQGNGVNGPCIMTYNSVGCIVEHNELYNANSGVFIKEGATSEHSGWTIRFNKIYNCGQAVHLIGTWPKKDLNYCYQNLAYDVSTGLYFSNGAPTAASGDPEIDGIRLGHNWRAYNNTVILRDTAGTSEQGGIDVKAMVAEATTNEIYDNLLSRSVSSRSDYMARYRTSALPVSSYNFYDNEALSDSFYVNSTNYSSLAAFQAANTGKESGSTIGAASFVDASARDYRLSPGSAALTASSTSGPVGCYITGNEVIGIRAFE